jgi:hypothetical protein
MRQGRMAAAGRWLAPMVFAAAAMLERSSPGDVYEFVAGGRVEGPPAVDGEPIRLGSPHVARTFDRADFRRIEPAAWPPAEWPARREAALAGTSNDRHAASLWALDHGLVEEAAALWRESRELDPEHPEIGRLARVLDALKHERPDPDLTAFAGLVPEGFQVERGPHVLVWHRHEPEEARARVALLERAVAAFYLEFARHGLVLEIPPTRLPSIWFDERADYLRYLDAEGASAFRGTRGYHNPTRGLVACYDARSDESQRRARESIAARRSELAAFRDRIAQAPAGARIRLGALGTNGETFTRARASETLDRLGRDLDRQELLLDLAWQALDEGNAAHELVHQLVSRSGLAPRYAALPTWLHEGLAMQFEAFRGGVWAGCGTPVEIRLRDFRSLRSARPLAALLRDEGLGSGYRDAPYAAAWAWVYYLRTQRADAWIALIDALRRPTPDPRPATTRSRDALQSILEDDMLQWERDWHQAIERLDPSNRPASRRG